MSDEGKRMLLIVAILFLLGIIGVGLFYSQKQKLDSAALPQVPLPDGVQPTTGPDPEVATWKAFSDPQYKFSMNVPEGWNIQDYRALNPTGGPLIAFSPDPLPCASCSYIKNGYASLRIFNEKSDPEYYTLYLGRKQQLGKNKAYQEIVLGEKKGLLSGNTVAVENGGLIYELTLDKNNGTASLDDAPIFKQMINSLTFQQDLLQM